MNEPPADADVLVYRHGPNVAIEPRNSAARKVVETVLGDDALGGCGNATIIEESRLVPLVDKMMLASLNVVAQKTLIESGPRLYVSDGKWGHYNSGGIIPETLVDLILKGAGTPN
jgi:hypothetical protein